MNSLKTLLYFFLICVSLFSCKKKDNSTAVIKKNLVQAVYASGKIYPINYYKVIAKFPGYISSIYVKAGQLVKAGDTLAIIKNESIQVNTDIALNNSQMATRISDNLMRSAASDYSSAIAKFDLDSINYLRYDNLFKNGAISRMQTDQAKTQFEISKQNLIKTKNNYQSIKDKAITDAENASLNYKAANSNLNDYVLKAEKSGKIYNTDVEIGELVNSNKVLFEIGNSNLFEVELSIDETDINFIKQGQQILFTIDAFGEQIFKGSVKEIYPSISNVNRTSKVIAEIEQNAQIISGLSAEANIIIQEKKNTLIIPREFLINNTFIKLKDSDQLTKIKTGISDLENIEVLEGINENDIIVKP
jgi:HlyD family secretion protein